MLLEGVVHFTKYHHGEGRFCVKIGSNISRHQPGSLFFVLTQVK